MMATMIRKMLQLSDVNGWTIVILCSLFMVFFRPHLLYVQSPSIVEGFQFQIPPTPYRHFHQQKRRFYVSVVQPRTPITFENTKYQQQLILYATMSKIDDTNEKKNNNNAVKNAFMVNQNITANDLRKITVTNADGKEVSLGEMMGSGISIVIFMRHLGCFNCWSYAREWTTELRHDDGDGSSTGSKNELRNNIVGPIYVSIGDEQRLNAFLEKNPDVPRSQMLVDGYDFKAYKEAGFGRFDEKPSSMTENVVPKPIILGGLQGWWTFLTSFAPLAPVTPDMKFPEMLTPEGLFWVGGTMVIRGDDIIYRWNDRISGDTPSAREVLAIAKEAAASAPKG